MQNYYTRIASGLLTFPCGDRLLLLRSALPVPIAIRRKRSPRNRHSPRAAWGFPNNDYATRPSHAHHAASSRSASLGPIQAPWGEIKPSCKTVIGNT